MRNNVLAFLISVLLPGCMMWDAGYTSNAPVTRYTLQELAKVPVSYSVTLYTFDEDIAVPTETSLRQNVGEALRDTGLFSEVRYGNGEDPYHIAFRFWLSGEENNVKNITALIAGYTWLLVPVGGVMTFDGDVIISLQGKAIYSSAKAEEMHEVIWIPVAPFGLFMNSWMAWRDLERGTINALVNDVAKEHNKRFLSEEKVQQQ